MNLLFTIWQMEQSQLQSQTLRSLRPRRKKISMAKLRRISRIKHPRRGGRTSMEALSLWEAAADISCVPWTPEQPWTRQSTQPPGPGMKKEEKGGGSATFTKPVDADMTGSTRVVKLCKMSSSYPTEVVPEGCWGSCVESAREEVASQHHPETILVIHTGHHWGKRAVFLCCLWLHLFLSIGFPCMEYIRNMSSPPSGRLIWAV